MEKTFFIGGAHRGGRAVTEAVLAGAFLNNKSQVFIADPKEERAERLALAWRSNGVPAHGLKEPCEEAIEKIRPDRAILSIDTLTPMERILKKGGVHTQWQLLARGPGAKGAVIGLSGTVSRWDEESRDSSVRLIGKLASLIRPESSAAIRDNLLNADSLHIARRKVSLHSARRLEVLDREPKDISGGTLNLHWGDSAYPLAVKEKEGESWSEAKAQVLEAALKASKTFAVALIEKNNAEFFILEDVRGKRVIRFHLPLSAPKPVSVHNGSAVGLGLGALATIGLVALAAAPLVTD